MKKENVFLIIGLNQLSFNYIASRYMLYFIDCNLPLLCSTSESKYNEQGEKDLSAISIASVTAAISLQRHEN